MSSYKPTVYEQIVIDMLKGSDLSYERYSAEWEKRGWNEKQFNAYLITMRHIRKAVEAPDYNRNETIASICQDHIVPDEDIIRYTLTDEEKQLVLRMEDEGRVKVGDVITYKGFKDKFGEIGDYQGKIRGYDYLDLPEDTDAFVVFSGHPAAARPAALAWLAHLRKSGTPAKLVFLGLHDNQGNTSFNDQTRKYAVDSEAEMYRRCFKDLGISQEIIDSCIITPTDISTADNIEMLRLVRQRDFPKYYTDKSGKAHKKAVKFAMFAYPAYGKRIASEFALAFQRFSDEHKVNATEFIIPDIVPSQNLNERTATYDALDKVAADIMHNCRGHINRPDTRTRYDSGMGKFPDEFKPLLTLTMLYSYPNVPQELADTDTEVADMMKIHRAALQHVIYGLEDMDKTDKWIEDMIMRTKRDAVRAGLNSAWLMKNGNSLSAQQYVAKYTTEFTPYQKMREINHEKDNRPSIKQLLKEGR